MQEQICDMDRLYKGVTAGFNEVDYLSDVAMLFHDFHKAMSKVGMTKLSTKKMKENSTVFPDQYNRVAKNGCIAVLVDNRTNLPLAILTPYGALSLNAVQTLKSQVTYENEFADLTEKFGLVKSDSLNSLGRVHGMGTPLFSVFAVTKIPAKERKSIFSRQNKENKTTKFTLPQPTSFEIPSEARDSLKYPHKKYSVVYHTNKSNAVFELARESEHLRKVLDVVNVRFVRDNHSEYILPGTESQLSINGTRCDLKHYLKKVPNACEQFEILLQEDNAKNAAMVAAIEQRYSSVNNYVTDDPIQKFTSVNMVNIEDGREM